MKTVSIIKIAYLIFSIVFLIYLIWPYEPSSIYEFSSLPNSVRSTLSGDTVEVENLTAYFSNNYRHFVSPFYLNEYKLFSNMPIPPLKLIHPPESAFVFIKDQTHSTYLEEYTYPLRGSIFVNGLEPFDETTKEHRYSAAAYFDQDGQEYETKVVIRLYKSPIIFRLIVWFGINMIAFLLSKLTKEVFSHE